MGVGRGTVSFLHQPDSDTCLSSPDNKPPNNTSGEDSTSPTNKSSPTSLLSSRVSTPDWLGAGRGQSGHVWVGGQPQLGLLSQQGIWGNPRAQCLGQKGAVLHLVPFTNTATIEKGMCQRGQSTVLFCQGLHSPLE